MFVANEFERLYAVGILAYIKALSQHFLGRTEKSLENFSRGQHSDRHLPDTSQKHCSLSQDAWYNSVV
jgi:hypothetical protein